MLIPRLPFFHAVLVAAVPLAAVAVEVGPAVAGFRGPDGSGIFPDVRPPTGDLKQRWATELPSWGHCSPIAVAGKVLVAVEPREGERDFPALVCLDGASGEILWDRPLDHLSAVPKGVAVPARQALHELMVSMAQRFELARRYKENKDEAPITAAGMEWNGRWKRVEPTKANEREWKERRKIAERAGITLTTWRHACAFASTNEVGTAFATPVSDGQHVWSTTAWGGFFCHDLEGEQVWVAFHPGDPGEYCRNGRSPILWNELLLSDITGVARAIDARTGRLRWSHPVGTGSVVSPVVLTVDGVDVLLCSGPKAFRLPDGKSLEIDGWKHSGFQMLTKHDERDVVFFCGTGQHCGWGGKKNDPANRVPPAAVRFALADDTLQAEVLWDGSDLGDGLKDGGGPWMTVFGNRFYHCRGPILDALTGEVIRDGKATPPSAYLRLVAGGHIFGLDNKKRLLSIHAVDGSPVGTFTIPRAAGADLGWGDGKKADYLNGAGGPTFVPTDGAIYVRSHIHLHCLTGG